MTEKEAIIIEEIYLIENSLKEKTLNKEYSKKMNSKKRKWLQIF